MLRIYIRLLQFVKWAEIVAGIRELNIKFSTSEEMVLETYTILTAKIDGTQDDLLLLKLKLSHLATFEWYETHV